jgi:HEAT repeat protein
MAELKTLQEIMAETAAGKETADPEITSVKQLLRLLDKTSKSTRTYGASNPVAQKFFQQFYEDLTKHLGTYGRLGFLVQRSELYFKEEVVYQTKDEAAGENLAFKLYADGIRELMFIDGVPQEDLMFFLDSLWSGGTGDENDDDIVTRLWSKNLSTITVVTAEEIAKASGAAGIGDALSLQINGTLNAPVSSLRELLDRERANLGKGSGGGTDAGIAGTAGATGGTGAETVRKPSRFRSDLVGYEVSEEEVAALAKEIEAESARDSTTYVLDMLTAILASEKTPAVLTRLFEVFGIILESMTRQGNWTVLETVLSLLHETEAVRPDVSAEHKQQLTGLFESLGRPDRIKLIETYLNHTPNAITEGLSTLFLLMKPDSVPALCALLASLENLAHQTIVCEALFNLAKEAPEPVLKGLTDKRPTHVRNLLSIVIRWNNPQHADAVEKAIRYPDAQVRKEVVRTLGLLRPSGNGAKLVGLLSDPDEPVRLAALKLLMTGHYTAPFTLWSPLITPEEFHNRTPSEKRAIFQAMRQTAGDNAVPYWQHLFTEWSWTNRQKREELAVLAADALGKLGSPAALAALDVGQKKGNATVRQACATALAMAARQQRPKQAVGQK